MALSRFTRRPRIGPETWTPEGTTVTQRYRALEGATVLVYTCDGERNALYYAAACLGCTFREAHNGHGSTLAGVVEHKRAAKGVLITTSWFRRASHVFARQHGRLHLIEGPELKYLIKEHFNQRGSEVESLTGTPAITRTFSAAGATGSSKARQPAVAALPAWGCLWG